jgi:transcription initiation factor TFIIIB Brf1 subunit/transcription initiation factor TFIIB
MRRYRAKCPKCGGKELMFDRVNGELVCIEDGTIIQDHLFEGSA